MRTILVLLVSLVALACEGGSSVMENDPGPDRPSPIHGQMLRDLATPAIATINGHPDVFAGVYLDEARTVVNILYVGDEAVARELLSDVLPADLPAAWRHVQRSATELSTIKQQVIEFWEQLQPRQRISEVSVDLPSNRVIVGTPQADPEVAAQLQARFADAVSFAIVPHSSYE